MSVHEPVDRAAALQRVVEQRDRGRAKPAPLRIANAIAGLLAGIAAIPLVIVLPELGIPLLLVALRLLAIEFDWAARAYAWILWRWSRAKTWFHSASAPAKVATTLVLIAIALGLIWLLFHEIG